MKNKKGFTLVEIIVSISLILTIIIVAIPVTSNILEKNTKKQYVAYIDQFKSSAKSYVNDNKEIIDALKNKKQIFEFLSLKELQNKNYLQELPKNPETDKEFKSTSGIKITYDDGSNGLVYTYLSSEIKPYIKLNAKNETIEYYQREMYNLLNGVSIIDSDGTEICTENTCNNITIKNPIICNEDPCEFNTNLSVGKNIFTYSYDHNGTELVAQRNITVNPNPEDIIKLQFTNKFPNKLLSTEMSSLQSEYVAYWLYNLDYINIFDRNNNLVKDVSNLNIECKFQNISGDRYNYKCTITNSDGSIIKAEKEVIITDKLSDYVLNQKDSLILSNGEYYYPNSSKDNYVKFANKIWRIIKVDKNNNVKLILNGDTDSLVKFHTTNCCNDRSCDNLNFVYSNNGIWTHLKDFYAGLPFDSKSNVNTSETWIYGKDTSSTSTYIGGLLYDEYNIITEGGANKTGYLNIDKAYWTISTNSVNIHANYGYANKYYVNEDGGMAYCLARDNQWSVRPVIVLKNCTTISSGIGQSDEPYVVNGGC